MRNTYFVPHGHPHLLQNEFALEIVAGRGQSFRAARNHDHVRSQNSMPLKKFISRQTDALVETA
jgi:hypothetical protein